MPKLDMVPGTSLGKHRNGRYHWRGSIPGLGERIVSTGETDLKIAIKAGREIERALLREAQIGESRAYGKIAEEAFSVRMQTNRDTTEDQARPIYDQLIAAFGAETPIDEVTESRWLEQVETWKRTTRRKAFANIRKYAIQIDNYAFRKGYKKSRNDFPIKDPKKREGVIVPDERFREAMQGAVTRPPFPRKFSNDLLRLFIALSRGTELTYLDICRLRWPDLESIAAGKPGLLGLAASARKDTACEWVFPDRSRKGPMGFPTAKVRLWEVGYTQELSDSAVEELLARVEARAGDRVPLTGEPLEEGRALQLFLVMCRSMGMRRSEATLLPVGQIDPRARSITLTADQTKTGSKTGRGRQFGIAPEAWPLLAEALACASMRWLHPNEGGTGPVDRDYFNKRVRRLCVELWPEKEFYFRPHDLRHTFLTQKLLVEKKNPMDVAIYAGVSLQVIQDVYLHPKVDDTRHVVEAVTPVVAPEPPPALAVLQGGRA